MHYIMRKKTPLFVSFMSTKHLFMAAALFILCPQLAWTQTFTLSDAINSSLTNNEKIKQYQEKLAQKKFQDLESWGNFMPVVNFEASYNHLNDPLEFDLSPVRDVILTLQSKTQTELTNIYSTMKGQPLNDAQKAAVYAQAYGSLNNLIPPFKETLKKQDYKTATLVGLQPLFTGGKLYAAKKYASDEKQAAEIELEKTRNEIIQETVNNYLSVVLLKNVVKTRQDVLAGIIRHKNDADKLYAQGLIANYHLLRAEVAVADAERNLSDDQNRLELAMIALKHSAGIPEEETLIVSDSLRYTAVNDSLSFYIQQSHQNQQILKLIDKKKDAASDKYIAERAAFLPQLAAFGKYEMYPEYLSSLEPRWVVGVQMKFNLFNGFRDYSRLQNAVHLKKEVSFIEAETRRKIDLWVNKSFRDVQNAKTRYVKLEKTLNLAGESLRLNEKRFQSGMGTSLEVIDAQLSLEKNRIESLISLYDYYRSLTDLFNASGNPREILTVWNKEN